MQVKNLERVGVVLTIAGSFTNAYGYFALGYSAWIVSSILLLLVAYKQNNGNLILLQGSFVLSSMIGAYKNILPIVQKMLALF